MKSIEIIIDVSFDIDYARLIHKIVFKNSSSNQMISFKSKLSRSIDDIKKNDISINVYLKPNEVTTLYFYEKKENKLKYMNYNYYDFKSTGNKITFSVKFDEWIYFGGNIISDSLKTIVYIEKEFSLHKIEIRDNKVENLRILNDYKVETEFYFEELEIFLDIRSRLFINSLNVIIIFLENTDSWAMSVLNLIVINSRLLEQYKPTFYLYIIHELIHQNIGNDIYFRGAGSLFMTESLTEYLSILYLKCRFKNNIYLNILNKKKRIVFENKNINIDVNGITLNSDQKEIELGIYNIGVLLFYNYFESDGNSNLNLFEFLDFFNKKKKKLFLVSEVPDIKKILNGKEILK